MKKMESMKENKVLNLIGNILYTILTLATIILLILLEIAIFKLKL